MLPADGPNCRDLRWAHPDAALDTLHRRERDPCFACQRLLLPAEKQSLQFDEIDDGGSIEHKSRCGIDCGHGREYDAVRR